MALSTDNGWDGSGRPEILSQGPPPSVGVDELASAQPQDTAAPNRPDPAAQSSARKVVKCRFFTSQKGCRAGEACPYLHDPLDHERKRAQAKPSKAQPQGSSPANGIPPAQDSAQGVATGVRNLSMNDSQPMPGPSVSSSFALPQRPISKAESLDPREFQINQLRRRFRPTEESDESGTSLAFGMAPSDPDFPFELDKLQCIMHVPQSYPARGRPTITLTNPEIGDNWKANVSRGFDDIVDTTFRSQSRGTLLGWMNSLDRHLERLLTTTERGPTLKFVPNIGVKEPAVNEPVQSQRLPAEPRPIQPVKPAPTRPLVAQPAPRVFTAEEKAQAEKRRATETKQIEARLGRLPLFQKSKDEVSFVIPIQPTKVNQLPVPLRPVKTVKLLVPQLYPLEPSSIELQGVDGSEARSVKTGFEQWIGDNGSLNLMSQINYLTSNMHKLAKTPLKEAALVSDPLPEPSLPEALEEPQATEDSLVADHDDRPHIRVVPRPPEWDVTEHGDDSEDPDLSDSEEYTEEDEEDGGAPVPNLPEPTTVGRGVALSFPSLEHYGIELLEISSLHITVKCERCKEHTDVKNVPHVSDKNGAFSPKVESCRKCANVMSLGFRRQLVHMSSNRAGYLDLDGCTVVDLLPSNFTPTCAECSTPFPAPGVVAVRGESAMAICRHCHRKMVLKIPEVKFLIVGSAAFSSRDKLPNRKRPKEVLGIVAGQELPRRGRCTHYAKSYRWFRFSCCAKVFPCDKCHDAETDHPNEHANRMLCGFCSREQIYRPENCGICRAVLIGKAGSGFWEGGKGTRNRVLMSRKDPRKFKRRGGTTPGGASSSKRK
ncbi:hypothetical protein AWENTII_011467 [Aspergillus wentii]